MVGRIARICAVLVVAGSSLLIAAAPAHGAESDITCSKGGGTNPILQGSGVAGGATCTFTGWPASTAVTISGGLALTPTTTNVDGSATGTLYSVCTDTVGNHDITVTIGDATGELTVTVGTNPDFATDCPTSTTSSSSTTTSTAAASTTTSAVAAKAVATNPSFTG